MKKLTRALVLGTLLVLTACATTKQESVALAPQALDPQAGRIGVVMAKLPPIGTNLPGAGCLLCMAAASMANSSLSDYSKTLSYEDLPQLKNDLAQLLAKRGASAIVITEDIDLESLGSPSATGPNVAKKDFGPLQQKYGVDRLLVVEVTTLGFERSYSAYIPTSDPKGVFRGAGYIVNLKSNTYEWYLPVQVLKSADKQWDEAPKFPGLTNAYYQALELGKDELRKAFNQP
jgi:hypothetical protein